MFAYIPICHTIIVPWFLSAIYPCFECLILPSATVLSFSIDLFLMLSTRYWGHDFYLYLTNMFDNVCKSSHMVQSMGFNIYNHTIMYCLAVPSHYLNYCWLIISKVQWNLPWSISKRVSYPSIFEISLKITPWKFHANLPGASDLKQGQK